MGSGFDSRWDWGTGRIACRMGVGVDLDGSPGWSGREAGESDRLCHMARWWLAGGGTTTVLLCTFVALWDLAGGVFTGRVEVWDILTESDEECKLATSTAQDC